MTDLSVQLATLLTRAEMIRLLHKLRRGADYAWEAYVGDSRADIRLAEIHGELAAMANHLYRQL